MLITSGQPQRGRQPRQRNLLLPGLSNGRVRLTSPRPLNHQTLTRRNRSQLVKQVNRADDLTEQREFVLLKLIFTENIGPQPAPVGPGALRRAGYFRFGHNRPPLVEIRCSPYVFAFLIPLASLCFFVF
jgi:hypothetical protein